MPIKSRSTERGPAEIGSRVDDILSGKRQDRSRAKKVFAHLADRRAATTGCASTHELLPSTSIRKREAGSSADVDWYDEREEGVGPLRFEVAVRERRSCSRQTHPGSWAIVARTGSRAGRPFQGRKQDPYRVVYFVDGDL